MWEIMLINLVIGLGSALTTSIGTYVAKKEKAKAEGVVEDFNMGKFARTMSTGILSGIITYFAGGGVSNPEATVVGNLGIVNVLDQGIKFFWRLFSKKK